MDDLELETTPADEPDVTAYTHKVWRDVQLVLDRQVALDSRLPPEGEDYGPWAPQMDLLLWVFKTGGVWKFEEELLGLLEGDKDGTQPLPDRPITPDGRTWQEMLEERWARAERLEALYDKADKQLEVRQKRARWRAMSPSRVLLSLERYVSLVVSALSKIEVRVYT